jgi:hypothetical protein
VLLSHASYALVTYIYMVDIDPHSFSCGSCLTRIGRTEEGWAWVARWMDVGNHIRALPLRAFSNTLRCSGSASCCNGSIVEWPNAHAISHIVVSRFVS